MNKVEEIRAEKIRIDDLRDAKYGLLRDAIREIRKGIDIELDILSKSYQARISEEYRISRKVLIDKKTKLRERAR